MTESRSNGQAQVDVLLGVRSALVETLVQAPNELVPGLTLAVKVLDGTLVALGFELD